MTVGKLFEDCGTQAEFLPASQRKRMERGNPQGAMVGSRFCVTFVDAKVTRRAGAEARVMWAPTMRTDEVRRSNGFHDADHRRTKVKVAGTRPGRRHPFGKPPKMGAKASWADAGLLDLLTMSRFPLCFTYSARRP
jgi:hypothetical protein